MNTIVGSRVLCNAAVDERGVYRLVELIAGGGEEQAVMRLLLLVEAAVVDALQKVEGRVGMLLNDLLDAVERSSYLTIATTA